MRRVVTSLAILAVAFTGAAGCRATTGKTLGTSIDNRALKHNVKARLVADRVGNLTRIGVNANQGVVYLTGTVETPEQREHAAAVARRAGGVREVVNNIQVETARTSAATTPPGQTVQARPEDTAVLPSAAPKARHTLTGEVTDIDAGLGRVTVRSGQRDLELYVPPATLQNVQRGDQVSVEIAVRPVR
jgi:hypothetical protein